MNYLAHIYLSGNSDPIKVGNFIGDFVKGNSHSQFPEQVAYGILLHRRIDSFTDQHATVRECIQLLRPGYGKYAGIIADVFFDHFLASNWKDYSHDSLRRFTKDAHTLFLANFGLLPFRVKQFLPFLIYHKRLESYAVRENLFAVFEIMSRHTSLPANSQWAMDTLNEKYDQFEDHFRSFFPELIDYVESEFGVTIPRPGKQ